MYSKTDLTKQTSRYQGIFCVLSIYAILIICVSFYMYSPTNVYVKSKIYFTNKTEIIWKGVWNNFFNDKVDEVQSQPDIKQRLNDSIISGKIEPLLTLFTTWNNNPEKYVVHNNTVRNWLSFRPFVIPVIFVNFDETSIASECRRNGWGVLPVRVTAGDGVPVLKFMYLDAMREYNTTYYAYSNSDILYTDTLVDTLIGSAYNLSYLNSTYSDDAFVNGKSVYTQQPTLIVGQRTNVPSVTTVEGSTWEGITSVAKDRGALFFQYAIDYFITSRNYPWKDAEEVIIGTPTYDLWVIYNARRHRHTVIDATATLLAVHQTTGSGNYESHKHKSYLYNLLLMKKMRMLFRPTYTYTVCAEYFTKYSQDYVLVTNRSLSKQCDRW